MIRGVLLSEYSFINSIGQYIVGRFVCTDINGGGYRDGREVGWYIGNRKAGK